MPRSTRQQGNDNETRFGRLLQAEGYYTQYSRGSLGVDILAVPIDKESKLPLLAVEVGTKGKSITDAFRKMRLHRLPVGTLILVARWVKRDRQKGFWSIHCDEDSWHDCVMDAIIHAVDIAA